MEMEDNKQEQLETQEGLCEDMAKVTLDEEYGVEEEVKESEEVVDSVKKPVRYYTAEEIDTDSEYEGWAKELMLNEDRDVPLLESDSEYEIDYEDTLSRSDRLKVNFNFPLHPSTKDSSDDDEEAPVEPPVKPRVVAPARPPFLKPLYLRELEKKQ